jgi:hypothetical protein
MKLFFSLLLFPMLNSASAKSIRIFYHYNSDEAVIVKNLFLQKYNIPEKLISLEYQEKACHKQLPSQVLDICIDDLGEMKVLAYNKEIIRKSFAIFRKNYQEQI